MTRSAVQTHCAGATAPAMPQDGARPANRARPGPTSHHPHLAPLGAST